MRVIRLARGLELRPQASTQKQWLCLPEKGVTKVTFKCLVLSSGDRQDSFHVAWEGKTGTKSAHLGVSNHLRGLT